MEHLVWWCEFLPLSELNTLIIKVPAPMQKSWICLKQYYLTETINLIKNLRVVEYLKHIFLGNKPNIYFLKNPNVRLHQYVSRPQHPATVYDMDPYLNKNRAETSLTFTYLCPLTPCMIIKQFIILVISWSTGNQSVSFFDKSFIM